MTPDLQDDLIKPRGGLESEGEDPQLVATRGANSITSRLKRAIESGVYSDGDQLPPERQLAVAFGTARSTIRKALDQLEQKNLVVRRVGSGTFVSYQGPVQDAMSDVTDLISPLQLIEARIAIEPSMSRLAALHASARDLDAIESILLRIEATTDDQDLFTKLDSEFHLALARCSRNPLLYRLYQHINTVRNHAQWEQMKQIILVREKIDIYNQQHRAIFEALKMRDPATAADLISKHLETARQDLVGADSI
jgi:DNA-binding FadR family transcriptional regulator